jgi:DNA-binding response OmpR family regulator
MPTHNKPRVLFVDDDEDACEMLALLMSSCGIDAICARSAVEARALMSERSFDLFVLDGWLPGIDGFELCRQIREFDSDTPILFYSGAAYDTDKEMGMAAGANAYVTKPDVEGLINTIAELMAKVRGRQVDSRLVVKYLPPVELRLANGFFGGENGEQLGGGVKSFRAARRVNTVVSLRAISPPEEHQLLDKRQRSNYENK